MLETLGGVRKRGEPLQSFPEVRHPFQMGRALNGALPRPLPVRNGLCAQACLGVVMGQHLRLGFADLGKVRL
jgi:hypothetical protein